MTRPARVLAVIPARGGSQGLPGKNIRLFAGLPLIAHSIVFARQCPEIDRVVVSTDSLEIAQVARAYGADVPFIRPADLARSETPMWPVLRHALRFIEERESPAFDFLMLLDPTSPAREPADVTEGLRQLSKDADAVGIVSVSEPPFNPIWHCVVNRRGYMEDLLETGSGFTRRQDVPKVYRINGALYIWRADFVRRQEIGWRGQGKHLMLEIPEIRAMSIDDLQQFEAAEALVKAKLVTLSWLAGAERRP
ncbi:MAG: acylneuraminate cytidylyltransferase family protein [Nitrospiraceae bacterium]|nr:acylneuraminate cytidylyltransferase family protein [Nitrospiraceae bacterium]